MPKDNSGDEQEIPAWRSRNRKRGILTESDRTFLAEGIEDVEGETSIKQTLRDKRYRIRERLKDAYLDFNYLAGIGEDDRKKVFQYLIDEGGPTLQSVFEELYLGITSLSIDSTGEPDLDTLAGVLERAIKDAERRERNYIAKVSVNIDVERTRPDTETLLDKFLEKQGTLEEFLYYMNNDGDRAKLFNSVVEQDEPLIVTSDLDDSKVELIGVEEAEALLERETELLDENTAE